jgi:hypothetical protein
MYCWVRLRLDVVRSVRGLSAELEVSNRLTNVTHFLRGSTAGI